MTRAGGLSSRRTFLALAGAAVLAPAFGCAPKYGDPVRPDPGPGGGNGGGVDLGTGDTAVLNYAVALEQLEATFFTEVLKAPWPGMTLDETYLLRDIRDHEKVHRDFLRSVLGLSAIRGLKIDLSSVTLTDRASVLENARTLEDLVVTAYNGAATLVSSDDLLGVLAKVASVEARHSAAIRDLMEPGSAAFSGDDIVDASTGQDRLRMPSAVLEIASHWITTPIDRGDLP